MRSVISVSLSDEMASALNKATKETGKGKSEIIKEALRRYLWEERFVNVKKGLKQKAKKIGVVTDEDVFKLIS
jgi:metal-responsive CopG/Arc/MetJ family transcriptional regulator